MSQAPLTTHISSTKKSFPNVLPAIAKKHLTQAVSAIVLSSLAAGSFAAVGNPRVNQEGYLPNGAKTASYKTDSLVAEAWQLKQDGVVITSGNTVPLGIDAASGDNIQILDFSSTEATGDGFTLSIGNDQSYPFSISADVFREALYDSLKYFYHNRSGIAIETQYTGGGNTSYAPNAQWAHPAGHINVSPNKGDYDVPCWSGTCNYSLDVPKGWYDAGDHGKYVVNGGISVWKLLNMYERSLYFGDNAARFADGTLNIPESGNGIPDILDEVRWEMEFLISMQVPAGQTKAGMVHHKMHDVGWTGFPLAPNEDPQDRALVPPTTAATLNLAATGAQCARLWQNIDSAFASSCLTAAERAWDAAQQNPNVLYSGDYDNGGGGYGDNNVSDEFYWAAAELYITTGDSKYLPTINSYEIERTDLSWADTELPGLMSLAVVPTDHTAALRTQAQQKIEQIADYHVSVINSTGYRTPNTEEEYYWGSNNGVANKLFLVGLAYDFTGEQNYARAFSTAVDYLFGRNPLSFSYISGHGESALTQPHHRFWSGAMNSSYPWAPPGAMAGGPNSGLDDPYSAANLASCVSKPATCYVDNIEAYATNEITINWNSALAWVLAFDDDLGGAAEPENQAPTATLAYTSDGDVIYSGTQIDFTVQASDPEGDTLSYEWRYDGDLVSTSATASVVTSYGTHEMVVTVTDSEGASTSDSYSFWTSVDSGSSSSSSSSSSAPSSSSSSIVSSSSSSISGAQQCNWYGTLYPLCTTTQSGWGWEDNHSCIAISTCSSQPAPYGVVGGGSSASSSAPSSSSSSSVTPSSSSSSSVMPSSSSSSSSSSAIGTGGNCQYVVSNEWNTGFTGAIRITNDGSSAINGWNVSWSYNDGSKITSSWNATVSGSNPYSASNLNWNGSIQPGQTVEFGFQGTKGGSAASTPVVSGSACD